VKVSVIGAGFVGLTTACVLANRGIETTIHDVDQEKIDKIFAGIVPFYEPELEHLLGRVLNEGLLKRHDWEAASDLVIVCAGTPSLADGSIDTSQVEQVIGECATHLPRGALVAIKSTVVPGTTRHLQKIFSENLELVMIPEFLREGSAVNDALYPDRNVIGARSRELGKKVAEILCLTQSDCIITSTFSAESIKYLSNAFLATCISFTNETFGSLNEDSDFEITDIISGWHSDRRFKSNNGNTAAITSYLTPGPGFGGSCFPKDVRALSANIKANGRQSPILDGVLYANKTTLTESVEWLSTLLPNDEPYALLGIGFKDESDDIRESPGLNLANLLASLEKDGFWYDQYVNDVPSIVKLKRAYLEKLIETRFFILMHHHEYYRDLLKEIRDRRDINSKLTVFAMRYQEPIDGFTWLYPRSKS
jgi:nucleotide sugar dehydrogenase